MDDIELEQKDQKKEVGRHADDIQALKEAIEELKGTNRGGARVPTSKATNGASTTELQKRIRIGGWSPYGSPTQSRISAKEADELQKKISAMFTWAQTLAWRWDRPWLTNYQLIDHTHRRRIIDQRRLYRQK